jgi:septal ring factor EnvC (AmiA/AmiB activator)
MTTAIVVQDQPPNSARRLERKKPKALGRWRRRRFFAREADMLKPQTLALSLLSLLVLCWHGSAPGSDAAAKRTLADTVTAVGVHLKTVTPKQALEDQDMEAFQEELQRLLEELKKLEKEGEETFRKEILPQLRREMERFKEWLRKLKPQEESQEPIKI